MKAGALKERIEKANKGLTCFEKGRLVSSIFGSMVNRIVKKADEAMDGLMILPGTGAKLFFVGSPTNWLDNPTGNPEYTFQLNRMVFIKTLSEAFSITGDEKYAQKAISELLGWIRTVKRPEMKDENGLFITGNFDGPDSKAWRALETGIRCYRTWPVIIEQLVYSKHFTNEVLETLLGSISMHLEVLYNISPILWPKADHNHYLMENLGLYTMAVMFPELDRDGTYRRHAANELKRCMKAQCTKEGGQIEGCPSYHNGCVYWFSLKNNVEERYGIKSDPEYTSGIFRMFDHSLHATRNMGGNIPWGDSHTKPVETCSVAAVGAYLATGDPLFLQKALYMSSLEIIENDLSDNLFRMPDLRRLEKDYPGITNNPVRPDLPLLHYAAALDQVYARTGWDKEDMTFMTACRTPVQNMHAHIDPCSFDLSAYGDVLVADPGIYTYKAGPERYRFKSTLSHSCVSVNGRDAWEYKGPWEYGEQKEGKVVSVTQEGGMIRIVERHENYFPVTITRVFHIIGRDILILDIAENMKEGDEAYISFHFDTRKLEISDSLHVSTKKESNAEMDMAFSSSGPYIVENGKISESNDTWRDSTILRLIRKGCNGGMVNASLLLPRRRTDERREAAVSVIMKDKDDFEIVFEIDGKKSSVAYCGKGLQDEYSDN